VSERGGSLWTELRRRNVIRVAIAYVVASWLLIEAATVALEGFGAPGWVPKAVAVLLALGFPVALIFSWVYEMTPEGLKRESDIQRDDSVTAHTAKKLDLAVIVLLLLAIGMFAADRFLPDEVGPPPGAIAETVAAGAAPTSEVAAGAAPTQLLALGVAVLPFTNLSTDAENAFFASGVHEDVLTYLSRVADLRVISRTSVENYVDSELSLPAIGRELGVSHVVEGSVRRAGNRVRVTVQLIDAATDSHIWSENYDRTLDDIFAIQTEIAQQIVARVEAELSPAEAAELTEIPTSSTEAYDAFLRARERWHREWSSNRDSESIARISDEYLRVTQLDPAFLEAWMEVVRAASWAVWTRREPDVNRARASDALARMRVLEPDAAETHFAAGIYAYRVETDLQSALVSLDAAITLYPNLVAAQITKAWVARRLGLWDAAIAAARRAVELDPASPETHRVLIDILADRGEFQAARVAASLAEARFPEVADFAMKRAAHRMRVDGDVSEIALLVHEMAPEDRKPAPEALYRGVFGSPQAALAWIESLPPSGSAAPGFGGKDLLMAVYLEELGDEAAALARYRAAFDIARPYLSNPVATGNQFLYGFAAVLAAQSGDREDAETLRARILAFAGQTDDRLAGTRARTAAAQTRAALGDAIGGWEELQPLIGQPGGPSRWDLVLGLQSRKQFGTAPGYQALVAEMEAERDTAREAMP
jgi:TolB-like protein